MTTAIFQRIKRVVKTFRNTKEAAAKSKHNTCQLQMTFSYLRGFFLMNLIRHCVCHIWSLIFHSCFGAVHLCFRSHENERTWFCFSVHFTVDELPDRLRQHGVLRSPGENRARRGGISNSGERSESVFIGSLLTRISFIALLMIWLSIQVWTRFFFFPFLPALLFDNVFISI